MRDVLPCFFCFPLLVFDSSQPLELFCPRDNSQLDHVFTTWKSNPDYHITMSEVQARSSAARGRGSARGGRGGFASRGGRSGGRANGPDSKTDGVDNPSAFDDDQGVIADLKKQYGDKTPVIKEMFPEWSEVDILFALQETDGDETEAVTRIAEGKPVPSPSPICRLNGRHLVTCIIAISRR